MHLCCRIIIKHLYFSCLLCHFPYRSTRARLAHILSRHHGIRFRLSVVVFLFPCVSLCALLLLLCYILHTLIVLLALKIPCVAFVRSAATAPLAPFSYTSMRTSRPGPLYWHELEKEPSVMQVVYLRRPHVRPCTVRQNKPRLWRVRLRDHPRVLRVVGQSTSDV
jgi:hypothetical protein